MPITALPMRDAYRGGGRVRGGARFRLLAHSQTETGVKRYFFIFPFLQPRRGTCLKLKGYNFISFIG